MLRIRKVGPAKAGKAETEPTRPARVLKVDQTHRPDTVYGPLACKFQQDSILDRPRRPRIDLAAGPTVDPARGPTRTAAESAGPTPMTRNSGFIASSQKAVAHKGQSPAPYRPAPPWSGKLGRAGPPAPRLRLRRGRLGRHAKGSARRPGALTVRERESFGHGRPYRCG